MPEKPERPTTRFLASLYSPPARRPVLEALLDIEHEIAESLRPGLDHRVAHTRLQWWREECERVVQGKPVHPLTRELVSADQRVPPPVGGPTDAATLGSDHSVGVSNSPGGAGADEND